MNFEQTERIEYSILDAVKYDKRLLKTHREQLVERRMELDYIIARFIDDHADLLETSKFHKSFYVKKTNEYRNINRLLALIDFYDK